MNLHGRLGGGKTRARHPRPHVGLGEATAEKVKPVGQLLVEDTERRQEPPPCHRETTPDAPVVSGSIVRLDPLARAVWVGGRRIALTRLEFDLLLFLAENPGRTYSRQHLMAEIWRSEQAGTRTVDVHVRRIRAKTAGALIVTTVRSVGYRLAMDARVDVVGRPGRCRGVDPSAGRPEAHDDAHGKR